MIVIRFEGRHPRPDGISIDLVLEEDGRPVGQMEAQVAGPAPNLRALLAADLEFGSALTTDDHPCSYIRSDRFSLHADGAFEHVHEEGRPGNPNRVVRKGAWMLEDDFTVRVALASVLEQPAALIAPSDGRRWSWQPDDADATFDNLGSERTSVGLEPFEDAEWPTPQSLFIAATIVPASGAGSNVRREIVSRSLEAGQRQFPFGLRLTADNSLEGWVNTSGTSLAVCHSARALPLDERSRVSMSYDGEAIVLAIGGDEVARCAAFGSIQNRTGRTVIGGQRHGSTRANGFKGRIEAVVVRAGTIG